MEATSGEGGKGDAPRPVDKRKYDAGYLRAFGKKCPDCKDGVAGIPDFEGTDYVCTMSYCQTCGGVGYVPKDKPKRIKKDEIPE